MARKLGRYELLRPLGRGGMAEVFLARRRGPGGVEKRLVVKRIRRERAKDPRFVSMFVREAQVSMSLAHKNIVPMFDFGRAGNELFLVMEYVKGLDLGLATTEVESGGGKIRGTPMYMSPEQACGEPVDGRSDLFSLGLILWEALAGRRAYGRGDPTSILGLAREAKVPALPSEVPEELHDIVARAPQRNPGERFRTARDMQMALDGYVVAARAQSSGHRAQPLGHWLAESVRQALEESPQLGPETQLEQMPRGEVVTFLDDGEQGLEKITTTNATIRSLAETVAGEDGSEPAHEPDSNPHGETHSESYDEHPAVLPFMETDPDSAQQAVYRAAKKAGGDRAESAAELDDSPRSGRRGIMWLSAAAIAAAIVIATVWRIDSTSSEPRSALPSDTERASPAFDRNGTATEARPTEARPTEARPSASPDAGVATASGLAASPDEPGDTPGHTTPATPRNPPGPNSEPGQNINPKPSQKIPHKPSRKQNPQAGQKTVSKAVRKPGPKTDRAESNRVDALGSVRVSTSPWATVSVSGRSESCRDTPCKLDLPPGTYSVTLHNPVKNVGKTVDVHVKAGETATIREILTRAP